MAKAQPKLGLFAPPNVGAPKMRVGGGVRGGGGALAAVAAAGGMRRPRRTPRSILRLSALVVVHNEERQLAECLETLRFAGEIVVVLDSCTDGSKEIAATFTDRLIEGSWPLEGARRNAGIEACSAAWVLELDADERVSEALAAEILVAIDGHGGDWFEVPVDNYVGERLVRYGWAARSAAAPMRHCSAREPRHGGTTVSIPRLASKAPRACGWRTASSITWPAISQA